MTEPRKFTPEEIFRITGWTTKEAAKMLECSPATVIRKKKTGSWSLADLRIMTEAAQIPVENVAF